MSPGSIVTGTIVDIDDDWDVIVHAGLKSEGLFQRQFLNETGDFDINGETKSRSQWSH